MKTSDFSIIINKRIKILSFFLLVLGIVLIGHLFSIQILKHDIYETLAEKQHNASQIIQPKRGIIYTQDISGKQTALALNKTGYLFYIVPKLLKDANKEFLAEKIALILNLDKNEILKKINKADDPFEPIKDDITNVEMKAIDELGFKGKGFNYLESNYRFYPQNNFLSQVIGYYGFNGDKQTGNYGIEEYYNDVLDGSLNYVKAQQDKTDKLIPEANNFKLINESAEIILTIDQNIQMVVEEKLKKVVEKWNAKTGLAIVIEPKTGKILAMAQTPSFNPNNYFKIEDYSIFKNRNIQEVYEPGSVIKPITAAIALELGKITPDTTFNDEGWIKIGGYIIKDFDGKAHGIQTMTNVLEKSLNLGAVFMQQLIGKENFLKYFRDFGLDELTEIDLAGEIRGKMVNLYSNRDINFATASFGQGIAVTPIELIRAFATIANGGVMMKPYIVDKIIYSDGSQKINQPVKKRTVISKTTADTVTKMLVNVVTNGFDKARIKGYFVAGKTGTAQIPNLEGGGYSEEFIHTFVGYAPAFNPKFVILVRMDKPKGITFAADSLSPVFKEIAEYILNYYKIPTDLK